VVASAALGAAWLFWSGSQRSATPDAAEPPEAAEAAASQPEARTRLGLNLITALVDPAAATPEERLSLDEAFHVADGAVTIVSRCGETAAMPAAAAARSWRLSCGRRGVSVDFGRSEHAATLRLASAAQSVEACRALTPRVTAALGRVLEPRTSGAAAAPPP
jgi:hypothetical protein